MSHAMNLCGQRFGRLVTLYRLSGKWFCECDCGEMHCATTGSLRAGKTLSCGCLNDEKRRANRTHGLSDSPEHAAWVSMKQRCLNPNSRMYHRYGGRGIGVWQEWVGSFESFFAAVGPRPAGHSLERVDNEGGYVPGNVKWATRAEQQKNTCRNRFITHDGVTLHVSEWARRLGLSDRTVSDRYHRGLPTEQVLAPRKR
jgi:hypothetical protein